MAKGKLHLPADLDLDTVVARPGAGRPPVAFHEEPLPTSYPLPSRPFLRLTCTRSRI